MKIIVLSDTHRALRDSYGIIDACRQGCDLVIHLGDVVRDLEDLKLTYPDLNFVGVSGNNDFVSHGYERELILDLDGVRTVICHGHEYGVKRSLDQLLWHAQARASSLALFGHTHEPERVVKEGVTLFNPGTASIGQFGIIHIEKGKIASADTLVWDRFKGEIR